MTRDNRGRFILGGNGGPGRPPGSRNSLGNEVVAAIRADWQRHGAAIIEKVRKANPSAYLKAVINLVPREIVLDSTSDFSELSDEELMAEYCETFVNMAINFKQPKLADAIKRHMPKINPDRDEGKRK